ncbi:MAG: fused MFS/spermidine synthase [Planctomycetota bacterium]|nr:fused MFS/spermidine synthase [Planctomycetota bacterium]
MNKSKSFFSILIPSATVFFSSACIMVLELVAGRLIARYLGSSLYTWTSVIGVVLAGIAIGNYLGGRIADRFQARKTLAALFAVSSAACVVVIILNNLVGEWIWLWRLSWPLRVFTHVSLVFLLPSTLLGTISPVVAKMALERGLPTGRTVGDIYAWGAAGSIAGTFVAGFYLIAAMGTVAIIWTVGGALLLLAILYWVRSWPLRVWMVVFISALFMAVAPMQWCRTAGAALALREKPDPKVIYQDESQYCYIAVRQVSENPDRRIFMQDKFRDSDIIIGDINDLQYFYTTMFAAVTRGLSQGKKTLCVFNIGGGGYVFPRYVEHNWPGSRIDVAEIDPAVTEAAMQAFGLRRDTAINTIHMDARNYVDQLLEDQRKEGPKIKYDFIYEDAFNDYSVPYQLVTKEFHDKIFKILSDDGVYIINMIDVYDSGLFLGAYVNTLEKTFPFVYVLSEAGAPTSIRDTFSVVASKRQLDLPALIRAYRNDLEVRYLTPSDIQTVKQKAGQVVLTDDYVPVENMLAPVVLQSAGEFLGSKYFDRAAELAKLSRSNESIAGYKRAAQAFPQLTLTAYNQIGLIYAQQGDLNNSINAFQKAIDYNKRTAERGNVASIYFNLGVALQKLNRNKEATDHFLKAVEGFRKELKKFPTSPELYARLGDTLASLGDFKAAAQAFQQALNLEPHSFINYYNLAKALEFQGLYDQAIAAAQKGVLYMQSVGQKQAAAQLQIYLDYLQSQKLQKK